MVTDSQISYGKIICMIVCVSVSRTDFSIFFPKVLLFLNFLHHLPLSYKQTLKAEN